MVVIYRFVAGGSVERTHPLVDGIFTEGNHFIFIAAPEVAVHRLPDYGSQAHAAAQGLVAQLAIGLLGKTQVGDDVAGHGGITISRYRQCGKWRPDPLFL